MNREERFFLFLLEYYAYAKQRPTAEVLDEWEANGIVQRVFDNFLQYSSEAIENAVEDIDSILETGKPAW